MSPCSTLLLSCFGECASAVSQPGVGRSLNANEPWICPVARRLATDHLETAGYQRFSGPPDGWWQGLDCFIIDALILMGDWCDFIDTSKLRTWVRKRLSNTALSTTND